MARHVAYYDHDRSAAVTCSMCGWTGTGSDHEELHQDLFDVSCGSCGKMLIIVPFPTLAEVRTAADAGNEDAISDLPHIEEQAAIRERAWATHLERPEQLPELPDEPLIIEWAIVNSDDEHWQVLRHSEREIWREHAYYESYKRFEAIFQILRNRYGERFIELRPTAGSEYWLYGDAISAPKRIDELNQSIRTVGG